MKYKIIPVTPDDNGEFEIPYGWEVVQFFDIFGYAWILLKEAV